MDAPWIPPAPPQQLVSRDQRIRAGVLIALGGAIVAIGAFLPWVKATAVFVGEISTSGMDGGDGWIALALGVASIAVGLGLSLGSSEFGGQVWGVLIALGTGALTLIEYIEVADRVEAANSDFGGYGVATVGAGIYAMGVGAMLVLIGALLVPRKR